MMPLKLIITTTVPSNLRHDHPRMSTLTRWYSYANLARIPWRYKGMCKNELPTSRLSKVIVWQTYRQTDSQVTCGHYRSCDKDNRYTIGSCVVYNPMLHAHLMALLFIEPALWSIEVYTAGISIFRRFRLTRPQLTLTRWPSYTNLTRITWRYSGCANMNFLR